MIGDLVQTTAGMWITRPPAHCPNGHDFGAGSSATVVNRAVGILAGILDDAVEHRALAFNPARRFKRGEKPKKSPKRHVYLTDEDVCRLAEESGRRADLVLTPAFAGLRWGEAIALTVADAEFLKRRVSVHRNAVQVGQIFEVGQTKGKESRTVPVAASVLVRLAARCDGRSARDGGYLKRPSYDSTGWFNRAVERAQVQTITPHNLRHSCASLAVSSGANVLAVSRMLGRKDPSVTLRIYADLFDSDLDALAVNVDAKIANSVQSVSKAPVDRRRKRRKAAVSLRPMHLKSKCPRGDLPTYDTGCDLAIEAVNASHAGAGYLSSADTRTLLSRC